MQRIPETFKKKIASHDPDLFWQVQDSDGTVRTFFEAHIKGNRKMRRARQQHYPWFTKKMTRGSLWNPRNTDESKTV